jgi:UDP-N-acetylmuramate--alanine ligase
VAEGEVWVVFQPHTTNRTAALLDEFGAAFGDARHALILPIYRPSGREVAARPVTSEDVVNRIQANGHLDARAVSGFEEAQILILAGAKAGDLVLTMGAGDVTLLSDRLVEALDR